MINLENVLLVEDRISLMHDKLKSPNYMEEGARVVELCEDWWEILRLESLLFEVYKIFKDEATQKSLRKTLIL